MNILAYQDVESIERELIGMTLPPALTLQLPEDAELKTLGKKQNLINDHAEIIKKEFLQKKIVVTDYLKIQQRSDANTALRMLLYNLLAAVFSPSLEASHLNPGYDYNNQLLKTIKCTLYSKDLKPTQVTNCTLKTTDQQARNMMAHFFKEIESFHQKGHSNEATLLYSWKILELNHHLMAIFISVFRFILAKLEIEGANDYEQTINAQEAIINIVEYFDLTYRHLQDLLLFHQQKLFLSILEKTLILGTYSESPTQSKSETNLQVKEWPINSLVVSLNGTGELTQTQQLKKKQIVVENDVKLLNCLLKSSHSSSQIQHQLKQSENETPHFQESKQLYFGRRKKDQSQLQMQKDLKKQFAKLILGSSQDTLRNKEEAQRNQQQIEQVDSRSPSNSKKQYQEKQHLLNFTKMPKSNSHKSKPKQSDAKRSSQGSELDSLIQSKNMVSTKVKMNSPSTPQVVKHRKERFGSLNNDFQFVFPEFCQQKHKQNIEPYTGQCPCFLKKLNRNQLASNTVTFNFMPVFHLKQTQAPLPKGRAAETPKIVVTSPQKYKQYCFRGDRVPTFLKTRIERNEVEPGSKEKPLKHTPSERNHTSSNLKQRKIQANQHFKHLSQIIQNNRPGDKALSPKKAESTNKKSIMKGATSIKKHDYHQICSRERFSGPSSNFWQTKSNINYEPNLNRNSYKQIYRKTLEQPTLSPNINSIISPFRTHSPRRHCEDQEILNQEEKDFHQDSLVGFRKLGENRSHPSLNYRPSNYL